CTGGVTRATCPPCIPSVPLCTLWDTLGYSLGDMVGPTRGPAGHDAAAEESDMHNDADAIVVGGGNAAFSAAHAAAGRGRSVLVLGRGAGPTAGGNSFFAAGASRIAHGGLEQLQEFVEVDERHGASTVPPCSPQ